MSETKELDILETEPKPKRKKKRIKLILFIFIIILALAAASAYYFWEKKKPEEALTKYLNSVQQMDFDSMTAMLQSKDLSALDDADIRTESYTDFFRSVNKKMTYEITRNKFDLHNGTARITAHIRYIDGTNIYKEAISEFLRQIVSSAFTGKELSEQETQEKLASILKEHSEKLDPIYSEIDILYPLIHVGGEWKIVSLDEQTVKMMSANFKNVQEEINQSIESAEPAEDGVNSVPSTPSDSVIDMTTEKFSIRYTHYRIAKDFAGNPCLMFYYDYTNNSSVASSAMVDVSLQAYQNGESCGVAIPESNDDAIDHFMSEIQPGQTINVCQVFALNGTSDVTLQANDAFNFNDSQTTTQSLKIE